MSEYKPLLATGELVKDYTPLFQYIKTAAEMGRDKAKEEVIIKNSDLEKVRELASTTKLSLPDLINRLSDYVRHRIDPEVAVKALAKYLGREVSEEYAVLYYSRLIACWAIEAATTLNMVKISGRAANLI